MAEEKNVVEMNPNTEEQKVEITAPETPDQKTDEKADEKKPGKIGSFFKKHSNKIKIGLGAVGAIGIGVAAVRLGLRLGSKKKGGDESGGSETAE